MTLNIEELKKKVNEEFVGKSFSQYGEGTNIYTVLSYIRDNFIPEEIRKHFIIQNEQRGQTATLNLRVWYTDSTSDWEKSVDKILLYVNIKKAKGAKHYGWVGSAYYDWSIKDIEIQAYDISGDCSRTEKDIDLDKALETIMNECKIIKDHNNEYFNQAVEIIASLKSKFSDPYELQRMLDYIKHKWYTIKGKVYKE